MKNLLVCIITSENNNNKQYVFYFYEHIAFLRIFFIKELAHYVAVDTFLD